MSSLQDLLGKDYMKKFEKLSKEKKEKVKAEFKKAIDLSEVPQQKSCTAETPDESLLV